MVAAIKIQDLSRYFANKLNKFKDVPYRSGVYKVTMKQSMVQSKAVSQFTLLINSYFNKRMGFILVLGFASGLPLALTGTLLQAWLTLSGIDLVSIGFLSLVGLPYVNKWIWAPLLDRYQLFGTWRRGWIWMMQGLLVLLLALMAFMDPGKIWELAAVAVFVAFASATLDIATDAYRTELLQAKERGTGTAVAVGGYRLSMLVSGGLSLIMADHYGFRFTYLFMAFTMLSCMLICFYLPVIAKDDTAIIETDIEPNLISNSNSKNSKLFSLFSPWLIPWIELSKRPQILLILAFIIFYKIGDAFAVSLSTTFLVRELGFSLTEIGIANKMVGVFASLLGVFWAGALLTQIGLYRALLYFGIVQAVTNLGYYLLVYFHPGFYWMAATIFMEHFAAGMGTAALLAFIMGQCNRKFTATQFALLTSLSAIGRVFISSFSGMLVENIGWGLFYFGTFLIALPPLVILWALRRQACFTE